MKRYALLLVVLAIAGCVGGPGYPPRRTLLPPPTPVITEAPTPPPTETPFPTVMPELPRPTPQVTPSQQAPPPPPQTIAPTQTPKPTIPVQQPLTLLWKYDTGFDIYGVGITEDGGMTVAGSGDFYIYAFNSTGGILWKYQAKGAVGDVAMTPKGDRIVATSFVTPESTLYLLDPKGRLVWKKGLENLSKGVDISADGNTIAVGLSNGKIQVLDRNGAIKWEYLTRDSPWGIWDVALKQDGGLVAGSDDTYLYVLNPKGELVFNDSQGSGLYINGVATSTEGDYIGVASRGKRKPGAPLQPGAIYLYQGNKLLWQFETGRLNYGVALTQKAEMVAVGSWDKNLYLLNNRGELVAKYQMDSYVNRVAFSGDGKYLATGTVDGSIYLFEVEP